jgi:hypothetical protein
VHRPDERHLRLVSEGSIELLPLLEAVADGGAEVTEARLIRPTLEEVLVRVTGIESAWMLMFYLRSRTPLDIRELLPGVVALSILFGTTSMLAVTITFERGSRCFERLLLAHLDLSLLMLAKTGGAILLILPLTYGVDILKGAINREAVLPLWVSFPVLLLLFALGLFLFSLRNIKRKWVL